MSKTTLDDEYGTTGKTPDPSAKNQPASEYYSATVEPFDEAASPSPLSKYMRGSNQGKLQRENNPSYSDLFMRQLSPLKEPKAIKRSRMNSNTKWHDQATQQRHDRIQTPQELLRSEIATSYIPQKSFREARLDEVPGRVSRCTLSC